MIKFACPGCAAGFTVADEKAGTKGKCPKCQTQFTIPAAAEASAPPPTKTADPAASAEPVEIKPCPKCGERLSVMASDIGLDIECPKCATVFKAAKAGGTAVSKKVDADDDRPSKRRRDEDDEDDDRPAKKKSKRADDDEDEDDRPSKRKGSRRDEEDDEDERPAKKKSARRDEEEDEKDEKPAKKKASKRGDDEDEEEDDRPSKSKSKRGRDDDEEEDEDDDRPRRSKGRKGGKVESKRMTAALLAFLVGGLGIHKFYLGYTTAGIVYILTCGLCGWGALIDAIIYFTKSDEDFIKIYQKGKKEWF